MKKIIALAMGIALFTESYGSEVSFLTPQRSISDSPFSTFAPTTSRKMQEFKGWSDWTSSTLTQAANMLSPFVHKFDPRQPLSDPTPLQEYNPLFINGFNDSFKKQGTNCSIPSCNEHAYMLNSEGKEALWDKYYTGAPAR